VPTLHDIEGSRLHATMRRLYTAKVVYLVQCCVCSIRHVELQVGRRHARVGVAALLTHKFHKERLALEAGEQMDYHRCIVLL
jgi:hypothetical protein